MPKDHELKKEILEDGTEKVTVIMKSDIIKKKGDDKATDSNPQ